MPDDRKELDHEELGEEQLDEAAGGLSIGPQVVRSSLSEIRRPIAGLDKVTNPSPTTLAGESETDAELRPRTKSSLE